MKRTLTIGIFNGIVAVTCAVAAVVQFMSGYPVAGAFGAFFALANAACFVANMVRAGRQRQAVVASGRRPDYSLIASMEREIYGEAFTHDGAPERRGRFGFTGEVTVSPERTRSGPCSGCGDPLTYSGGRCWRCYPRCDDYHVLMDGSRGCVRCGVDYAG